MKKTLIALAALGAIAGAHAQSTVTIYGLLDANIGSFKTNTVVGVVPATLTSAGTPNGTSVQNLTQAAQNEGALNGSRWGIRVSEDLGGGLAAVGNLESGFTLDNGSSAQGSRLFGRRANVGLSSAAAGTLVIGRNSSSYDDVGADHAMMAETIFDPSGTNNGIGANVAAGLTSTTGVTNAANFATFLGRNTSWIGYNTRFNNSIKYTSPTFSGFSGSAMYAFGEDKNLNAAGNQDATKSVSANLKYVNGPLLVSGAYQSEATGGTLTTPVGGNLNNLAATPGKPALQNTLLSVAYDFGVAKVGAGFNRAKFKDVLVSAGLPNAGGAFAAQKEYNLSVAVPVGAATISAGYAQSKGDTLGKSSGFGIQALYSLSKRTTLYTGLVSTKAYDQLAALAPAGSTIGKTQTFALGVRHTF